MFLQTLNFENKILNLSVDTQKKVLNDCMKKAQLQLIKQAHPYAITPPKQEGGRWQTYVKDASKKSGRREIKASSEEVLYEALAEYYLIGDTFSDVYKSWIDYISAYGKAGGTIQRYEQRYKKYFENSKIVGMSVRNVNLLTLEAECNRIVSEFNLSYHEWQQAKTILIGTFKYAVKNGLLAESPMKYVEIGVRFRQVVKAPSETQVYKTTEFNSLIAYLDKQYTESDDDSFLAIRFGLATGLRAGELAALQFGDIGEKLHVIREEVRDKTKVDGVWVSERVVVPHTKTYTDRYITFSPAALKVIKRLEDKYPDHKPTDFLFRRNGERLTERQLAYVLEKFSERQGVRTKSTHKMRKTYASKIFHAGTSLDRVREELGHRYLSSTEGYIYNPEDEKTTCDTIARDLDF